MGKKQIRNKILAERKKLDNKATILNSSEITENLKHLHTWRNLQTVHVYLPIEGKNEISTWPIVEWLLEKGHEVWASHLPEDESKDGFCQISKDTKYGEDRFGAPLPFEKVHKTIKPNVVIVPCLAVDQNGNRLGYGSGWYDRFLAKHPKTLKVGLVYEQFVLSKIPHEAHDIKLDMVLSESGVVRMQNEKS